MIVKFFFVSHNEKSLCFDGQWTTIITSRTNPVSPEEENI